MGPSLTVTGSVNATVFEAYLRQVLPPHLRPGRIVVIDNLSAHKSEQVRELIERVRCGVLYLPPYSPEYNPMKEAFSEIKGTLRKVAARSWEALVEAMGKTLDVVTATDARGFFEHCGYRAMVQPYWSPL